MRKQRLQPAAAIRAATAGRPASIPPSSPRRRAAGRPAAVRGGRGWTSPRRRRPRRVEAVVMPGLRGARRRVPPGTPGAYPPRRRRTRRAAAAAEPQRIVAPPPRPMCAAERRRRGSILTRARSSGGAAGRGLGGSCAPRRSGPGRARRGSTRTTLPAARSRRAVPGAANQRSERRDGLGRRRAGWKLRAAALHAHRPRRAAGRAVRGRDKARRRGRAT